MSDRKSKFRSRFTIVAAIVVVIIAGGFFSSMYFGTFNMTRNGQKQLLLIASEDEEVLSYGENVTVTMEVYNDGPTANFSVSSMWPTIGGERSRLPLGPCSFDWPYGFAVLNGYFTNGSIISGKPLMMWYPGVYMCPLIYTVSSYRILGSSDVAYLTGGGNPPPEFTLRSSVNFGGYWAQDGILNGSYHFVRFPAGEYTVVVADEWGAVQLLHFRVI